MKYLSDSLVLTSGTKVYLSNNYFKGFFFTLDAGLLVRSQYSEGPATGRHDAGFSWFPCA